MAASNPEPNSLLEEYADGKSKVTITGDESRVELMEKVLDMDDEISNLLSELRKKDSEKKSLVREVNDLKEEVEQAQDDGRRTEMDLLQELDMLHDKNSVMSNLLDIINERAEAAEEELEARIQEDAGQSPTRSTSNVSEVSALSNTSIGSDEVFAGHGKDGVILRDWEAKLKVRIDSLERLLAEERQKVTTAEKKLLLAGTDSLSPSVTDDVKMRMREKELLQEELLKSQKHLHIATDQIQGLKERVTILEEEHERLKQDYAKLYDEIDKPKESSTDVTPSASDSDKTPENVVEMEHPFVCNKISVLEAGKHEELKKSHTMPSSTTARDIVSMEDVSRDIVSMEDELAKYIEKTRELEYKVEEINDIWRSKSTTSDKERDELEIQLKYKLGEINLLDDTILTLKQELIDKDKFIAEQELAFKAKEDDISKNVEIVCDQERNDTQRERDYQTLVIQITQRDGTVLELNETLRLRDERLKEKDDMLFKLNTTVEKYKIKNNELEDENNKLDAMIVVLKGQTTVMMHQTPSFNEERLPCQTDAEKECFRLKEDLGKVLTALETSKVEKQGIESSLERSRQALDDAMYSWDKERNTLQKDVNILEEKVRLYDAYNSMNRDETIDSLKIETQHYYSEKESLTCELSSLRMKSEAADKCHKEQMAHLQAELSDKLRLLKSEVDNNVYINTELERLRRQAEVSYRLQQEERILRAEHLSLKARYESRIDKMNKENNKMLVSISKLQRELDLDKEIIKAIENNFSALSEKYTEELLRSQDDKTALDRHMKEIDESRAITDELQKQLRELREQTLDQERLRSELINRFATDRASWEIVKANLQSQINQLEEQVGNSCKLQERSKDIQVNMGMAWDKERREQRRLLQEAHTLALDLQEQLKSRDEAYAHERKELIRQMEIDRLTWTKDKRDNDRKMNECESTQRKIVALQKQLKESREKMEKEVDSWRKEKTEFLRLLTEYKHVQARDRQKVEDVLGGLLELKEFGTILQSTEKGNTMEEKPPDKSKVSEQNLLKYVMEAVCQISVAAEDLSNYANTPQDDAASCIAASEVQLMKDEVFEKFKTQSGSDIYLNADVSTRCSTTTCRVEQQTSMVSRQMTSEEARKFHALREVHAFAASSVPVSNANDTQHISSKAISHPVQIQSIGSQSVPYPLSSSVQSKNAQKEPSESVSDMTSQNQEVPAKTALANVDSIQKLEENLLSQAGKQQSQMSIAKEQTQTLNEATKLELNKVVEYDRKPGSQEETTKSYIGRSNTSPIPVILRSCEPIESRRYNRPPSYTSGTRSAASSRATTPETPDKYLSTALGHQEHSNSPSSFVIPHHRSLQYTSQQQAPKQEQSVVKAKRPMAFMKSLSVDSSLTLDKTDPHGRQGHGRISNGSSVSASTTPTSFSPPSLSKAASLRESFSPRTARRKFFEEPHLFPPNTYPYGYKSLPHRRSESPSIHMRQASLPDPSESIYEEVSSKLDTVSSNIRLSSSFDERMNHGASSEPKSEASLRQTESTDYTCLSSVPATLNEKPKSAKEKRKMFKKAISLDSHVGLSVAKAGASAMPPGAPSGFTPSEIIAAVKGKLKPMFKKKKSDVVGSHPKPIRSPSPLFIQTDVPSKSAKIGSQGATKLPVSVPRVDIDQLESPQDDEEKEVLSELPSERSRDTCRQKNTSKQQGEMGNKWRSMSVDREPQPCPPDQGLWKFNETAV